MIHMILLTRISRWSHCRLYRKCIGPFSYLPINLMSLKKRSIRVIIIIRYPWNKLIKMFKEKECFKCKRNSKKSLPLECTIPLILLSRVSLINRNVNWSIPDKPKYSIKISTISLENLWARKREVVKTQLNQRDYKDLGIKFNLK